MEYGSPSSGSSYSASHWVGELPLSQVMFHPKPLGHVTLLGVMRCSNSSDLASSTERSAVSDSMLMGSPVKLHHAMQICAALCYVGLANLDRVSIVAFADGPRDRLAAARGKGRIFKVFDFLRGVAPGGQTQTEDSARAFVHQNKRRGLAVLISDFYDPQGYETAINLLRYSRFEPFAIQIYDHDEAEPRLKGDLQLVDCETGEVREITVSRRILEAYVAQHRRFCQQLEEYCTGKQVPLFVADTRVPFDDLILRIFRRGGFLR